MRCTASLLAAPAVLAAVLAGCGMDRQSPASPPPSPAGRKAAPPVAERNLQSLGWQLPAVPQPIAAYVPAVRTGNLLFVSGQLPMLDGRLTATGRVGEAVSEDQARQAMRQAALNALAIVRAELGSLDHVRQVVRVVGYVACTADYGRQPEVTNAASEVFLELFGAERGRHSRLAIGAGSLPRNSPVELDLIVEIEP